MNKFNYKAFDKVNEICSFLEDDISKIVLKQRFMTNLTDDLSYMHNMLELTETFDFENALESFKAIEENYGIYDRMDVLSWLQSKDEKKPIILFGAGNASRYFMSLFSAAHINVEGYLDNNSRLTQKDGYPVFNINKDIEKIKGSYIIITSLIYKVEMYMQLEEFGIKKDDVYIPDENSLIVYSEKVYFDDSIWKAKDNEIFVDAGAYNMYTSYQFSNWCHNYSKIYALEPDKGNFELCKNNMSKYKLNNTELVNAGLWNENTILKFSHQGDLGAGSCVTDFGESSVDVVKLDDLLNGEKCTLIKMDIEGAELNALKGSAETILKWKPRLAICIYHKKEDIIDIPLYLKKLVPEYKFKLRQYSTYFYDTILYAYIE